MVIGRSLHALLYLLVMCELIPLTTFFRQHALPRRCACRDTPHARRQRIALRSGGCAITAFCDGRSDHTLMKLFIILTTLFGDHPRPIAGFIGDPRQARVQKFRWSLGDGRSRGRRRRGIRRCRLHHGLLRNTSSSQEAGQANEPIDHRYRMHS